MFLEDQFHTVPWLEYYADAYGISRTELQPIQATTFPITHLNPPTMLRESRPSFSLETDALTWDKVTSVPPTGRTTAVPATGRTSATESLWPMVPPSDDGNVLYGSRSSPARSAQSREVCIGGSCRRAAARRC